MATGSADSKEEKKKTSKASRSSLAFYIMPPTVSLSLSRPLGRLFVFKTRLRHTHTHVHDRLNLTSFDASPRFVFFLRPLYIISSDDMISERERERALIPGSGESGFFLSRADGMIL